MGKGSIVPPPVYSRPQQFQATAASSEAAEVLLGPTSTSWNLIGCFGSHFQEFLFIYIQELCLFIYQRYWHLSPNGHNSSIPSWNFPPFPWCNYAPQWCQCISERPVTGPPDESGLISSLLFQCEVIFKSLPHGCQLHAASKIIFPSRWHWFRHVVGRVHV